MTDHRPPPPEPEDCLIHSRASRFKGGTLIAEGVLDVETHRRRLADPDGYRPQRCPRCGCVVLHVHDYPERKPRADGCLVVVRIVRHICAELACRATWRILPAFLARHLHRTWRAVEWTVLPDAPVAPGAPPVPKRTAQRWHARLASAAKQLVVLLATSGGAVLEGLAQAVGLEATRHELVDAHAVVASSPVGRRLAEVAALVHRLERGLRLM
jgi:hypothetical protein